MTLYDYCDWKYRQPFEKQIPGRCSYNLRLPIALRRLADFIETHPGGDLIYDSQSVIKYEKISDDKKTTIIACIKEYNHEHHQAEV